MTLVSGVWSGEWVASRLGLGLVTEESLDSFDLNSLLGLALRRNAKRAQLLVSTVLGKHVPTDPRVVHESGLRLGRAVAAVVGAGDALVLGYAETATGLGHCVAEALGAMYLHSTRRVVPGVSASASFSEEHSHATEHQFLSENPGWLSAAGTVVLVDDELSTGRTALNTIAALQRVSPRSQYVIASLVDLRSAADRAEMASFAADSGLRLDVVALATGELTAADDRWPSVGQQLVADVLAGRARPVRRTAGEAGAAGGAGSVRRAAGRAGALLEIRPEWAPGVPEGGRHGITSAQTADLRVQLARLAVEISPQIKGDDVLVLGTEELMYAPLLLARELTSRLGVGRVRYSTTTRSPVLTVDEPGYAIRTALTFPAHDEPAGTGERYAYNVVPPAGSTAVSDVVLVIDAAGDTPELRGDGGLLDQLTRNFAHVVLVILPCYRPGVAQALRGPEFGSYAPDEVAWLLKDLSAVDLEAPVAEREAAIVRGTAHYAESLPIEYQPDAQYQALFDAALRSAARRVAVAVGVVTELVLAERGRSAVLVSLARAGTPVGILMRRWAQRRHGLDLPHYAVSIVRGRGIDINALHFVADRHRARDVMFVDGWTGKGAITRELSAAIDALTEPRLRELRSDLAVLADTGSCTPIFGTRDDFLIPSACLNSTVSGLVSRTVLNQLIGPADFHGAKFYSALAGADVSGRFLDEISEHFPVIDDEVQARLADHAQSDATPTWAGWRAVEAIQAEYGITDVNLVKPGVGETTRVLLRRVPWQILIRPDAIEELGHVLHLADARGVPVRPVVGLAYSCVGLIDPNPAARGSEG